MPVFCGKIITKKQLQNIHYIVKYGIGYLENNTDIFERIKSGVKMGFGDFVISQFIDVIEHIDESDKLLVFKYTRQGDEIKQGARLIVRNGQAAVFVHKGQIADIFGPGDYKLNTGNFPLLSTITAFTTLFNSPIKSDLYFVNTTQFINNNWKTKNPIIKRDEEMGMVRVTSYGKFSFKISEPRVFMTEMFGARNLNMTNDIIEYLVSMVSESIAQCLGECTKSVLDMATHYRELSQMITPYVNEKAKMLGISIAEATIENISLPPEVEKYIDEQSGIELASRNMDTFVQYQSARAIRDVAKQPGGMAGIGAGIAAGKTIAESMSEGLDKRNSKEEKKTNNKDGQKLEKSDESIADQLLKYNELLKQDILTQEEFDEIKSMLLKEIYNG